MKITLDMEPRDFDLLVEQSGKWVPSLADRLFVPAGGEQIVSENWGMVYWVGDACSALLAKSYLKSIGHTCDVAWDELLADYVVLTNYYSEVWKESGLV